MFTGFPRSSVSKDSACSSGDLGLIPGSGRSLGEGNGNPLQYTCLENSRKRGAWWAAVHGVTKSWVQLTNTSLHFIVFITFSFSTLEILLYCLLASIVAAEKIEHGLYSGDKGEPLEGFEFRSNLMNLPLGNWSGCSV